MISEISQLNIWKRPQGIVVLPTSMEKWWPTINKVLNTWIAIADSGKKNLKDSEIGTGSEAVSLPGQYNKSKVILHSKEMTEISAIL